MDQQERLETLAGLRLYVETSLRAGALWKHEADELINRLNAMASDSVGSQRSRAEHGYVR